MAEDGVARSAGQGLADGLGEAELPRCREHEEAVASSFVGEDLKIRQELGDVLDLVYDGALAEMRQEATGVRFGEDPLVGGLEIRVLQVGKG